jgi:hypothetical protein
MSVGRKSLTYGAAAAVAAVLIIAASFIYMGIPLPFQSTTSVKGQSVLAIRLTDPPQVPALTRSLNLTYSSISLLVGEPSSTPGQLDTKTVTLTPSGGSATLDLLKLQNVSQTIGSANLPSDSVIYSVTLTVSGIKIDVNGIISSVSLASGNSFSVTVADPHSLSGTNVALLQLNPIVVGTPSGYQLIPSSVGVIRHYEGEGQEEVGSQHQLTSEDEQDLESAHGSISASLVALSVSGDVTTVTVKVDNTGNVPVELNAIGLHGDFSVVGNPCQGQTTATTQTESSSQHGCELPEHTDQVVFVPEVPSESTTSTSTSTSASTTTSASGSCSAGMMSLVNGDKGDNNQGELALSPGQCVELTFTGKLSFGESQFVLVPSTLAGQTYVVHIISSNEANEQISCVLPLGPGSCNVIAPQTE